MRSGLVYNPGQLIRGDVATAPADNAGRVLSNSDRGTVRHDGEGRHRRCFQDHGRQEPEQRARCSHPSRSSPSCASPEGNVNGRLFLLSGWLPGGKDAKRSHFASKYFGRHIRDAKFTDPALTFHSLRKSWTQRAESAKVPESTCRKLMLTSGSP